MVKPRVWINKIVAKDGTSIVLNENDIVLFVGANNSGKSVSLNEIFNIVYSKSDKRLTKIIEDISVKTIGSFNEMIEYVTKFSNVYYSDRVYRGFGFESHESNIKQHWDNGDKSGIRELTALFVKILNTSERLGITHPPQNIPLTKTPPTHPVHFLQKSDSLEAKFNEYFKKTFGTDLIVHRNAGSQVPLYVGQKPNIVPGEDRVSEGYVKRLEELDLLHAQGDGMKSFVGVLLYAFISTYSILLLDEPEAFLHPPQAKLLGKMLAKDLPTDRQLFLATHSEDFLKGLLDSGNKKIKVIRINRKGNINYFNLLNEEEIKEIWKDPLLRHSNILSGLFHSKVVICESDSDCRFYSAILDTIYDEATEGFPDILFIHCGGKHRIPVAIKALKSLEVPIQVITDFDILNDEKPLRDIVEALGGEWIELKEKWRQIWSAIDSKRPELKRDDLSKEINAILNKNDSQSISKAELEEISKSLKRASPWAEAKSNGKAFIPSGASSVAFDELNSYASSIGLNIVEVGELESFYKKIGNHGPKWVNDVLSKALTNDPDLEVARKFVNRVISKV